MIWNDCWFCVIISFAFYLFIYFLFMHGDRWCRFMSLYPKRGSFSHLSDVRPKLPELLGKNTTKTFNVIAFNGNSAIKRDAEGRKESRKFFCRSHNFPDLFRSDIVVEEIIFLIIFLLSFSMLSYICNIISNTCLVRILIS